MKNELPDGWEWKKLGDIANVFNGKTPSKEEQRTSGHPILKIKDIDANGSFRGTFGSFVDNDFFEKNRFKCLKGGDTLILNAAHNSEYVGSKNCLISTFEDEVIPTGEWLISRSNSELLDNCFKHYLLTSQSFRVKIKSIVKGIHLYPKDVRNLRVPVPPLETQHKIVAILEKAEETKKLRAQADELTQQFLQNVFLDMFGDPINNRHTFKIGKIGDLLTKTQYGTSQKANEEEKGIPILRMNNITYEGNWNFASLKHIEFELKDKDKYLVNKGELLFNRTNSKELVGKSAVYRDDKPMAFAGYLIKLITDSPATSEYVAAHLNSKYGKMYLSNMAKSIVGMANINAKEVQRIPILIPPIELRAKYAEIISQISSTKKFQKQSSQELNILFNALMQKAFNGELVS